MDESTRRDLGTTMSDHVTRQWAGPIAGEEFRCTTRRRYSRARSTRRLPDHGFWSMEPEATCSTRPINPTPTRSSSTSKMLSTPKLKSSALRDVAKWLQNKWAWVRINDRSTPYWSDDVDHLKGVPGLAGVMLAKNRVCRTRHRDVRPAGRDDAGPRADRVGPGYRGGAHDRACSRRDAACVRQWRLPT